jgi:hypothetical protein
MWRGWDRVLISSDWETIFPLTNLSKNSKIMSDHNPLILCTDFEEKKKTDNFALKIAG